jgi:hypothetical protein
MPRWSADATVNDARLARIANVSCASRSQMPIHQRTTAVEARRGEPSALAGRAVSQIGCSHVFRIVGGYTHAARSRWSAERYPVDTRVGPGVGADARLLVVDGAGGGGQRLMLKRGPVSVRRHGRGDSRAPHPGVRGTLGRGGSGPPRFLSSATCSSLVVRARQRGARPRCGASRGRARRARPLARAQLAPARIRTGPPCQLRGRR